MTSPRPTVASLRAATEWLKLTPDTCPTCSTGETDEKTCLALLLDARNAEVMGLLRERITLDHEMMDREAEREDRCYPDLDMKAMKWRHRTNVYLAGSAQEPAEPGGDHED